MGGYGLPHISSEHKVSLLLGRPGFDLGRSGFFTPEVKVGPPDSQCLTPPA